VLFPHLHRGLAQLAEGRRVAFFVVFFLVGFARVDPLGAALWRDLETVGSQETCGVSSCLNEHFLQAGRIFAPQSQWNSSFLSIFLMLIFKILRIYILHNNKKFPLSNFF
jgi:hypothetical protein